MSRLSLRVPSPALCTIWVVAALLSACAAPSMIDRSGLTFSKAPLLGKVVWNDLITEDLAAARKFYGGMFGWSFEETTGPTGQDYVLAREGNTYVAGLVPVTSRTDSRISRWVPYVSVADVDEAVAKARAGGGTIVVEPREVGIGRVAAIVDPEGAVIGLARSSIGDPDDASTAPGAGRKVWTELLSGNPQAAAEFYRSVAGYETRTVERRGGEYTLLSSGGADRAGILRNPTGSWTALWLTSFGVEDAGAAAARAESLGGKVLLPASQQLREGTMAIVEDPSGAVLVLQELKK